MKCTLYGTVIGMAITFNVSVAGIADVLHQLRQECDEIVSATKGAILEQLQTTETVTE